MKTEPLITAIVVTHNRREELRRCLRSLATYEPSVEIIVVDNASDDGTDALLADHFPQVSVLTAPRNLGTSITRNAASRVARGEFLWFLDDDAELVQAGVGQRLRDLLAANAGLAAVGGEAVVDPRGRVVGVKRLNMQVNGMVRGEHLLDLVDGDLADADCLATSCLFIRRQAFEAVGGFDPMFTFYREDMDLCARLNHAGWRLAVMGRLAVVHHFATVGRGRRVFAPQVQRNVYLLRHRRWRDLMLMPLHDLVFLLSPRSFVRGLHFMRVSERGDKAMVVSSIGRRGIRVSALPRVAGRAVTLALAMAAGYALCLPYAPAAIRSRGVHVGGLADTRLDAFSIRGALPR
ncbi:MAG: glycosyltransferase family 2 protein [Gammaproteobacteria bacterium]